MSTISTVTAFCQDAVETPENSELIQRSYIIQLFDSTVKGSYKHEAFANTISVISANDVRENSDTWEESKPQNFNPFRSGTYTWGC